MSDRSLTLGSALTECVDAFKGLLILVVIMDHNNEAHALFPNTFRPLTFHVLGFLLLPFVIGRTRLTREFVLDRLARYWVPQFWILTIAASLLWLLQRRSEGPEEAIRDYVLGLVVGSGPLVKQSSGFLAYWFLPTILGLVIMLAFYRSVGTKWRNVMLVAFVGAHCTLVAIWFPGYYWVPFGMTIVANVFVLGLLFASFTRSRFVYTIRWVIPVAFVLSYGWLVYTAAWLEVAVLEMAPITNLATFIAQDVAGVSGVLVTLLLAHRLRTNSMLASIGRHSLLIYLLHPLVYALLEVARNLVAWRPASVVAATAFGASSYGIALSASWGIAVMIANSRRLSDWLTPRRFDGWPPIAALRTAKAS